jgi:SMI1 / KNR4 family (SUKH-1)
MNSTAEQSNDLIDKLKAQWSLRGIKTRHGVSLETIEAFESRYRVRLPDDLREYFIGVDGMEPGEMDADMFAFLPLAAVKSVPEELADFAGVPDYTETVRILPDPQHWFVIVDYLVRSAVFAIRLSDDPGSTPVVWIGDGRRHRLVAPSFSTFLEAYLADPDDLAMPKDSHD